MATEILTSARAIVATTDELHTAQLALEGHKLEGGHGAPISQRTVRTALLAVVSTLLLVAVLSPSFRVDLGTVISVLHGMDPAAIRNALNLEPSQ